MSLTPTQQTKELIEYHLRMARKYEAVNNKRKALIHILEANALRSQIGK